jgi:ABC-type transport system involved in multi-copper enzyme maturation permease subunit
MMRNPVLLRGKTSVASHDVLPAASRIGLIAQKEIRASLLNFKTPLAFVVLTVLFVVSARLLAGDYHERLENWKVNRAVLNDPPQAGTVSYNLPDGAFAYSVSVFHDLPIQNPLPISALVKGVGGEMDRPVTAIEVIVFGARQTENNLFSLFGAPDVSLLIKLLVSLFCILFCVDSITREKEGGTLQAILAQPVSRKDILMGKIVGAHVSIIAPFTFAYFSAVAYLWSKDALIGNRADYLRVVLLFFLSLLYCMVFIFLGLFISTIARRTKTAVVVALLVWVGLVLVLPNAAVLAARLSAPAPSYNQFDARREQLRREIILAELRAHPEARSFFETPNAFEANVRGLEMEKQLTDDFIASKLRQMDRAHNLAVIFPVGALGFGLSDVAGTGRSAYKSYMEFLKDGRDQVLDAFKHRYELPGQEGARLRREVASAVESRRLQAEPLSNSLTSAAPSVLSLFTWALLLSSMSYWRFQRYDVR